MTKNRIIQIIAVVIMIFIFYIIISFKQYYDYSIDLESQIEERDKLIHDLQKRDSILNLANDSSFLKSSNYLSTYSLNGTIVTPEDIVRYANRLALENKLIEDSLRYYKEYYNLSQSAHGNKFRVEVKGDSVSYQLTSTRLVVDTTKIDRLNKEINTLIVKNAQYKKALDEYGITIDHNQEKGTYQIKALHLDSALVLFPHYRDKLTISPDGKKWIIDTSRIKKK